MNYSYDADDRLSSDTYDANGNTILSSGISDSYDFENHLIKKGAVTIVYHGAGNCARLATWGYHYLGGPKRFPGQCEAGQLLRKLGCSRAV